MSNNIFSDKHIDEMCRVGMEDPVPLHTADLYRPFVYHRSFGVFYVDFGRHQLAMTTLLAWQHGMVKGSDIADKLKLKYFDESADYWLQYTKGSAFKSSVGRSIYAGKRENINVYERRYFTKIIYLFEDDLNTGEY